MKSHHLVIWTIGDGREVPPRAAVDDTGALLCFATTSVAAAFAERLRTYGLSTIVHAVSSEQVAELLAFTEGERAAHAVDRVVVVEAQATSAADAVQWAQELADRFIRRLVDGFAESQQRAENVSPGARR